MDATDLSGAHWRKSSRSNADKECVEVAGVGPAIAVRDSKNVAGQNVTLSGLAWALFVRQVKAGAHDLT